MISRRIISIFMKLADLIADKILDLPLMEMAYQRKIVIQQLYGVSLQLAIHMAKIFTIKDSRDKNHWIGEVNGWLNAINDKYVKPNNKKLPFSVYYTALWDGPLGHPDAVSLLLRGKARPNQIIITKNTQTDLQQIYIAICHDLANDDVHPIDVRQYLPKQS